MTKVRKRPNPEQVGDALPKQAPTDIAIVHGPTEDGEGARVLRFKEGSVYAGEVRPVKEGQAVEHRELVRLRPVAPNVPVCEVEVLHEPEARELPKRRSAGPARVSTAGYRRNWSAVFGRDRDESWSIN
jgi:hypothetical protein